MKLPPGYPTTDEGDFVRAVLAQIKGSNEPQNIRDEITAIRKTEREAGQINAHGPDIAKTQKDIFEVIREETGLNEYNLFDLTIYDEYFDSQNRYNAKIRQCSPEFNFFNFGWSESEDFMKLLSHKFVNEG